MINLKAVRVNNRTFSNVDQATEYVKSVSKIFPKEGSLDWEVEFIWDSKDNDSFEFIMQFMHVENPEYSEILHDIALYGRAEIVRIAEDPETTLGMKPEKRKLYIQTCSKFLKEYELPFPVSA